VTLQALPDEPELDAPKTDAPTERPSDATLTLESVCSQEAEKFIRYESQKPDQTVEAHTVHYDAETARCYVEEEFTVHDSKDVVKSTELRSRSYYKILDAFFEGADGPIYGEFLLRQNGVSVKGGFCGIWPYGNIGEHSDRAVKCRSEEEFNELTQKHFGTTLPSHRTSKRSQPATLKSGADRKDRKQEP
jgi:hypothetical protein